MRELLMRAFGVKYYQVSGPAWIDSERYEIAAKVPPNAAPAMLPLMLQSLLTERFGLVARLETRELPVYALEIAKNGPKLTHSSDAGTPTPGIPRIIKGADGYPEIAPGTELSRSYQIVLGGPDGILYKLWARHETMQDFADRLSGQLDRAVVDRTGLQGGYDFTLSWTIESANGTIPRTYPPPDQIETGSTSVLSDPGLSLFTALQARLGLRLEPGKGPLQKLIIEKIEKIPTGN